MDLLFSCQKQLHHHSSFPDGTTPTLVCVDMPNLLCPPLIQSKQVVWKWLIWERYYDEPPEQKFVDMCTIAKVSVLVLLEPYYGYYLHCRSPHQFADGSMAELVEMLHQEEVCTILTNVPLVILHLEIYIAYHAVVI
jgi:hypothetical protein